VRVASCVSPLRHEVLGPPAVILFHSRDVLFVVVGLEQAEDGVNAEVVVGCLDDPGDEGLEGLSGGDSESAFLEGFGEVPGDVMEVGVDKPVGISPNTFL